MKKTETLFSDIDSVDDSDLTAALDCIAAGIRASGPSAVIDQATTLDGTVLSADDDRCDLSRYGNVLLVGGGNAADVTMRPHHPVIHPSIP
ncbi:hypothetical protein V5735_23480 (plasmid) [Haladaptatus sp. SPP-AMP-3]|uniref:hypothetical protein n=1 Tax=Haladaptatus sp. SPP-AMP-3 TaxID=3121295 RepID=UPI003C2FB10E